jgi:hypothetical protein
MPRFPQNSLVHAPAATTICEHAMKPRFVAAPLTRPAERPMPLAAQCSMILKPCGALRAMRML